MSSKHRIPNAGSVTLVKNTAYISIYQKNWFVPVKTDKDQKTSSASRDAALLLCPGSKPTAS